MRRLLGLLAACGLLTLTAAGCHHTAGVCDCDLGHDSCYGCIGHDSVSVSHAPLVPHASSAPVTPMSKVDD